MAKTLEQKTIKSVKWSTLSTIIVTLAQFAQISLFAHFLNASEFGLLSILTLVVLLAQAFMDAGISNAIIQKQDITSQQLSSLFWLNIFMGGLLSFIFIASSSFIASFYDRSELVIPLQYVSPVFLIIAFGNQFKVLCQKSLQFRRIAVVDIIASVLALVVTFGGLYIGHGYVVIIYSIIVRASVTTLFFVVYGIRHQHRPALHFKISEISDFVRFGMFQMGERLVNFISAHFDKIIIGRVLGMDNLGYYNAAWQMAIFPVAKINPVLNRVAFTIYSRLQIDQKKFNYFYEITQRVLTCINIPLLIFLSFHAEDIVDVVYGEGWKTTVIVVKWLSIVGILKSFGNPGGPAILSRGRADVGFYWNIFWALLVSSALYISLNANFSLQELVLLLVGLNLFGGIIWHFVIVRFARVEYRAILLSWARIVSISIIIAKLSTLLSFDSFSSFFRVIFNALFCFFFYCIYIWIFERKAIRKFKSGLNEA